MSSLPQPPAPNWAQGSEQSSSLGWVAPMIVGAVILVFGCAGGFLVGWVGGNNNANAGNNMVGGSYSGSPFGSYSAFDATVDIQPTAPAAIGEPFDLVITITDDSGSPRTIEDIDFHDDLADDFEFVSTTPELYDYSVSPGYRENSFSQPFGPDAPFVATFRLRAKTETPVTGTITVYLDNFDSETFEVTLPPEPEFTP